MIKGIDVSVHQGKIDWSKVKQSPAKFAILRAGYGKEYYQKDLRFDENYSGCKGNGIPVGAYWYSYARSADDAGREAEVCLEIIKRKSFEYPIYYDIEDKSQITLGQSALEAIAETFCSRLKAAGYLVGLYSYTSFLEENFSPDFLSRYELWIARTNVESPDFPYPYGMWQYSHTGRINGIETNVDLNYSYKDYPAIIKAAGLNGFGTAPGEHFTVHTVSKGDTLWLLAERYLGNGGRYPEIIALNRLSSEELRPGQVLRIPLR